MDTRKSENRIADLRKVIAFHNELYYRDGSPEISDFEYDMLVRELEALEKDLGDSSSSSPTQNVGDDRIDAFESKAHRERMLSLDNAFSMEEIIQFHERLLKLFPEEELSYIVEPKIDGVAVSLSYINGKLSHALTRGNGVEGDDITHNVRTIGQLPTLLPPDSAPEVIEIRGEIYINESDFESINERITAEGLKPYKNPRNLAAGTVKLLDASEARKRKLQIVLYGIGYCSETFDTQDAVIKQYAAWDLPTSHYHILADSLEAVKSGILKLDIERRQFPYATDGAVVKLNNRALQAKAGTTQKAPRTMIAYKYATEQSETQLLDITVQVGRTGVLTPVAELQPVEIARTTVSRATLHNADEISRKDIRIGDTVVVEKAGEIIPAVIKVCFDKRPAHTEPYDLYNHLNGQCPACEKPIYRNENEVAWKCINPSCPPQLARSILFFASRKALDIDGLGNSVAEKITELSWVQNPLDLFTLDEAQLATLNLGSESHPHTFGAKNAAKVMASIQKAKQLPLHRWIYALGIPQVGEATALELSRLHSNFSELAESNILQKVLEKRNLEAEKKANPKEKHALQTRLDSIENELSAYRLTPEAGQAVAESVLHFFSSSYGALSLQQLEALAISPSSENYNPVPAESHETAGPLSSLTFVITGTLTKMSRSDAKALIESAGGKVSGSISKKTNYLIAGKDPGSKLTKAESLGVKIWSEDELLRNAKT